MLRTLFIAAACAASAMSAAPSAAAEKPAIYHGLFDDLAVGGYDPVAYFTSGKPVQGAKTFEHKYMNATWRFATADNLAAFKADPAKYAPQFGGHCAWAAAQGYTAKGDPRFWRIVDGKLYLNYDGNIQKRWEADIPGFIAKGNANWPAVLKK